MIPMRDFEILGLRVPPARAEQTLASFPRNTKFIASGELREYVWTDGRTDGRTERKIEQGGKRRES